MKNEVLRNNTSQSKSPYHSPTTVSGKCPDFSSIHLDTTGVRLLKLSRAASPLQLLHNMAHACQTHMTPIHNTRKRDSLVEVQGWTNVGQASRPCTSPPADQPPLPTHWGAPLQNSVVGSRYHDQYIPEVVKILASCHVMGCTKAGG